MHYNPENPPWRWPAQEWLVILTIRYDPVRPVARLERACCEQLRKPLLIYDGDCAFCRRSIEIWRRITRGRVDDEPLQTAHKRYPLIAWQEFDRAVHLIEPGGVVTRGAAALVRSFAHAGVRWPLMIYHLVPGAEALSEWLYARVAANRGWLSRACRVAEGGACGRTAGKR